jgi:hypothetical protein
MQQLVSPLLLSLGGGMSILGIMSMSSSAACNVK